MYTLSSGHAVYFHICLCLSVFAHTKMSVCVCVYVCVEGQNVNSDYMLLEKEMVNRCSVLACRLPWTEEPGGVWPIGLQSQTPLKQLIMHAQGGTRV